MARGGCCQITGDTLLQLSPPGLVDIGDHALEPPIVTVRNMTNVYTGGDEPVVFRQGGIDVVLLIHVGERRPTNFTRMFVISERFASAPADVRYEDVCVGSIAITDHFEIMRVLSNLKLVLLTFILAPVARDNEHHVQQSATGGHATLVEAIANALRSRSPAIAHVVVLEVRSPSPHDQRRAVLAWGIRADRQFRGSFADELFGIFVANDSLTRLSRTIDLIPTPRWLDYEITFERVTSDSIVVRGRGSTYGDQRFRRAYAW